MIRMASLTFVREENLFLVLDRFNFWQLVASENLMLLQDKVEKF